MGKMEERATASGRKMSAAAMFELAHTDEGCFLLNKGSSKN